MFTINVTGLYGMDIYLHNRDQMFFPNFNQAFGSYKHYINLWSSANWTSQHFTQLALMKTAVMAIDKPTDRCAEKKPESKDMLSYCYARFMESRLGCRQDIVNTFLQFFNKLCFRLNILGSNKLLPECNSTTNFRGLFRVIKYRKLQPNLVYYHTGCLSTCKKVGLQGKLSTL